FGPRLGEQAAVGAFEATLQNRAVDAFPVSDQGLVPVLQERRVIVAALVDQRAVDAGVARCEGDTPPAFEVAEEAGLPVRRAERRTAPPFGRGGRRRVFRRGWLTGIALKDFHHRRLRRSAPP